MGRKLCRRYNDHNHAHSLTFSCHQRLSLLARDRTRAWLVEAIEKAREREKFDLWGYVIMPEHVPILLRPREAVYEIGRILFQVKQPVARRAIDYLKIHAPEWLKRLTVVKEDGTEERRFWEAGGGYDRNITEEGTALKVIEYIHLNPVRRGLVERAEDWEWSSARWYAGVRPVLIEIDATLPWIQEG